MNKNLYVIIIACMITIIVQTPLYSGITMSTPKKPSNIEILISQYQMARLSTDPEARKLGITLESEIKKNLEQLNKKQKKFLITHDPLLLLFYNTPKKVNGDF